jgi:hypothetical protein
MQGLKVCLWIAGVLCLLSVVGVFLPMSACQSIASAFGVESLPDTPVVMYFVRLMSATYAAIGVYFIILALNPMKYGLMVPFTGFVSVLIGLVCLVTGLVVGMPAKWFLGDSVPCIMLGALILVFRQRVKTQPSA